MFQKGHTFYADWRDRSGTRKRKAFATAKAALKFERNKRTSPAQNSERAGDNHRDSARPIPRRGPPRLRLWITLCSRLDIRNGTTARLSPANYHATGANYDS